MLPESANTHDSGLDRLLIRFTKLFWMQHSLCDWDIEKHCTWNQQEWYLRLPSGYPELPVPQDPKKYCAYRLALYEIINHRSNRTRTIVFVSL